MFDVQFITHFTASISYPDSARIALEGGCRWVQLRMKDVSEEELKTQPCTCRNSAANTGLPSSLMIV